MFSESVNKVAMNKRWHVWILLLFPPILWGQKPLILTTDTLLWEQYRGKIQIPMKSTGDTSLPHGSIRFKSIPEIKSKQDTLCIEELSLNGTYLKGKLNGEWNIIQYKYHSHEWALIKGTTPRLHLSLNGTEERYTFNFRNGARHGIWEKNIKEIQKGRITSEQKIFQLRYDNNLLVGHFHIIGSQTDEIHQEIKGHCNPKGFLDGALHLRYREDSVCVEERRLYQDGFLLKVTKQYCENDSIFSQIEYSDVLQTLASLSENRSENIYHSEEGFGIDFNYGYALHHPKMQVQTYGNRHFNQMLSEIDAFNPSVAPAEYTLTRRFTYAYSASEDSMVGGILSMATHYRNELQEVLLRPGFKMRKGNSEPLSALYYRLNKAAEKLDLLIVQLELMEQGHFRFLDRQVYYREGIPGLDKVDTLYYTFQQKEYSEIFDIGIVIVSPFQLPIQIENYLELLWESVRMWRKQAENSLVQYQNQEFIDSLDLAIGQLEDQLKETYSKLGEYQKLKPDEVPFEYRMFMSLEHRVLVPLKAQYLQSGLEFEVAKELGHELCCIMETAIQEFQSFSKIGKMLRFWNDSIFTVFYPNPFDSRNFESKILSNTQQAATVLFRYYATRMLNAKHCQQLKEELELIHQLDKRVRYVGARAEQPQIILLDHALRREKTPTRIERILELKK
jgi:hypothetical protein